MKAIDFTTIATLNIVKTFISLFKSEYSVDDKLFYGNTMNAQITKNDCKIRTLLT